MTSVPLELLPSLTEQERAELDTVLEAPRIPAADEFIQSLTIEDPQGDGSVGYIDFELWPRQVEVLTTFEHERLVIVLKARQLGISWLACAYALWLCEFHPVKSVLIFSKGEAEATELVRRIAGMYHRQKGEKVKLVTDNAQSLSWANGSRVVSQPATKTAGSSFTASLVIADEFAKMQWADDLYTSMKPTIDGAGKLIIISTAQGNGNLFHTLWQRAVKGESAFAHVFLPWQARPDRTPEWYAAVSREAVSQSYLDQEYPAASDDAFNATNAEKFLPSMLWWDALQESLPALTPREPMVIALDAGIANDSFGLVAVTRHPSRHDDVAVRHVHEWKPPRDGTIDFQPVYDEIVALCKSWDVVQVTYDPYQLYDFAKRLQRDGVVMTSPFNQQAERLTADKMLLDLITQRRLAHDGNAALRAHVDHCDKKPDENKLRLVKRQDALKIDLAVATSMAAYRCLRLPL